METTCLINKKHCYGHNLIYFLGINQYESYGLRCYCSYHFKRIFDKSFKDTCKYLTKEQYDKMLILKE